jgi:hypothetical protein
MNYEYGVMAGTDPELHRGPFSKEFAERWIAEAESIGFKEGYFYLVVRSVSDWREVH